MKNKTKRAAKSSVIKLLDYLKNTQIDKEELLDYIVPAFKNEPRIYNDLFFIVPDLVIHDYDFDSFQIYDKDYIIGCRFNIRYDIEIEVDDFEKPIYKDIVDERDGKTYKDQLCGYEQKKILSKEYQLIEIRTVPNNDNLEVDKDGTYKPTLIFVSEMQNRAINNYLISQSNEDNNFRKQG